MTSLYNIMGAASSPYNWFITSFIAIIILASGFTIWLILLAKAKDKLQHMINRCSYLEDMMSSFKHLKYPPYFDHKALKNKDYVLEYYKECSLFDDIKKVGLISNRQMIEYILYGLQHSIYKVTNYVTINGFYLYDNNGVKITMYTDKDMSIQSIIIDVSHNNIMNGFKINSSKDIESNKDLLDEIFLIIKKRIRESVTQSLVESIQIRERE